MLRGSSHQDGPTWAMPVRRSRGYEAVAWLVTRILALVRWMMLLLTVTLSSVLGITAWLLAATAVAFVLLALIVRQLGG